MSFIIHLAEILYLSYLGTGSSSEPKLGYQERYHWDGDEARELLRDPGPWADSSMYRGVRARLGSGSQGRGTRQGRSQQWWV